MGYSAVHDDIENIKIGRKALKLPKKIIKAFALFLRIYSLYEKYDIETPIDSKQVSKVFDLIICNDVAALPLGNRISNGRVPIWADLHEYSPRQFENFKFWNTFIKPYVYWQTRKYLPSCQAITTVCKGLANEYEKEFKVEDIELVYNAPAFEKLQPSEIDDKIKLVHHGGATRHRKLENMVEMMQHLDDRFTLDFYLMANNEDAKQYESELKKLSEGQNVKFNDPVETQKIAKTLNKYDIGLFILEPVNFNYLNALPNKFFEYIQARLAIAISPNPEMKKLVEEHDLGVVADGYSAVKMAGRLSAMTKDKLRFYKRNADVQSENMSANRSQTTILKIVKKLLAGRQ
jgi:hypothetical protein